MNHITILETSATASSNVSAPGGAITGGYTGNSFAVRAILVFFPGLAMYNVLELLLLIFFTFSKFTGLYFWSLLIAAIGIVPYSLGFMFKFLSITTGPAKWFALTFITIGWWTMVTGQSVVLWSRLHLLVEPGLTGQRILRWTLVMIIVDAIILHIPTTALTWGSNGSVNVQSFVTGYNVMEKVQMAGFFVQEVILSSIYILQASRLLKSSMRQDRRKFMAQLVGINVLIILMDIGLVAAEAASFYLYETTIKGAIYSIKLKLEFAILGKLVQFVGRPGTSLANDERWRQVSATLPSMNEASSQGSSRLEEKSPARYPSLAHTNTGFLKPMELSEFVDLSKIRTNISQATHYTADSTYVHNGIAQGGRQRVRRNTLKRPGVSKQDIDFALFQHTDEMVLPEDEDGDNDDSVTIAGSTMPIVRDEEE